MHGMNWDDLKIVLYVAQKGSASAAARALGVNHATVVRRIKALEEEQGVRIFDHVSSGYRVAKGGEIFVTAAQSMSTAVLDLQRKVTGAEIDIEGPVRFTTTDGLFPLVADDLKGLHQLYPGIHLDLAITNQQVSLEDLDADLAIRTSLDEPKGLVCEHISCVNFAIYSNEAASSIEFAASSAKQRWIGLSPPLSTSAPGQWLDSQLSSDVIVMRCNSFLHVMNLIEQGLGVGVLPCFLGDTAESLHRVGGEPLTFSSNVWLVSHKDVLRSPRIKACFEYLLDAMRRKQPVLSGSDRAEPQTPGPGV